MKLQIVHIDLLEPIPRVRLRAEYDKFKLVLRAGVQPICEFEYGASSGQLARREMLRFAAETWGVELMRVLLNAALTAGVSHIPPRLQDVQRRTDTDELIDREWKVWVQYLATEVLSMEGMRSPYRDWFERVRQSHTRQEESLKHLKMTLVVCTADRPEHVRECIESLKAQDYPNFEILIADNSRNPELTRGVVEAAGVRYVRVPDRGLSYARNAALRAADAEWVAFTDDDCRPEPSWARELMRARYDRPRCMCVTGLVVAAKLEADAEHVFESYGGLGRGFRRKTYTRSFLRRFKTRPGATWNIGAGANMLVNRDYVLNLGAYDIDMGPGRPAGGCGEDTDVFYKILSNRRTIEYTPRAIVHHFHRCDASSLSYQIQSYAKGHAAYHVRCLVAYRDYRSAFQLFWHLPHFFVREIARSWRGQSRFPLFLHFCSVRGTIAGPWLYIGTKAARLGRFIARPLTGVFARREPAVQP